MTLDSLTTAASENLTYTYFELGRSVARSKVWKEDGFRACAGEIEHPICNFAADLNLNGASAGRLARIALDRPVFNVYATPLDRPDHAGDLLAKEGFCLSYRLSQLIADPDETPAKNLLVRAKTRYDRGQIALFMVDQFYSRQGQTFRQQVADATANASSLELLAMKRDGRLLGAAMICFAAGMAGVYNVCVDSSLRGLGIGTAMIREILAVCGTRRVPATLQCESKLEPWYRSIGFRRVGEIDVYALPKPGGFVIMQ